MKHYPKEGKATSTRAILPEDKQGMSLEQSDFMAISLQEIGGEPVQEKPAAPAMPNIASNRSKKSDKNQKDKEIKAEKITQPTPKEIQENKKETPKTTPKHSKANPNAGSVASRVLEKWGIDRAAAEKITAAGYAPFDAGKTIPKNIRSGRQKKENTQTAEKMLQQTFQAPYQPIDDPEPKPIAIEKPKKAAKNTKKSKTKAKKGSATRAVESLKWAVENSPAKQQRISADIQSADKAVARLFRSQRETPPIEPVGEKEKPFVKQTHHTISTAELQAVLLPNQEEISRQKTLKAVKLPKTKTKIKLPERKNKASAVQAVEALRWAVEHNPDKPKRQPEKSMPPLKPMEEDEKPFVEQTHHPISVEELQAVSLDEERNF